LALDCLDNEVVAAGVLIDSDSLWALKGEWVFIPLRPGLFVGLCKGPPGRVCFQWVIAAFSGTRGQMRRPGRLPVFALMTVRKG
jgi:hypothetical protein